MHDARRNQTQNRFFAIHPKGMTRIMPPLKPNDSARRFCEPINDLALTFVTPLGANHYDVLAHIG
jgi:hypothetical protein